MTAFLGKLTLLASLLAAVTLSTAVGRADMTTNLLSNPGAEAGSIAGWTVGGTSNPGVDSGTFDPGINPLSGSFDFYGHTGPEGTLTQNVSLVGNQGITAAGIDGGTLTANISFYEQGLNQGTLSDDARVTLTFLSATSTVLGTASSPQVDSHSGSWTNFSGSYVIPVGTRSIDYTMDFIRHAGSDNDSFVDNNSLTVTTPSSSSAVPEPSSFALMGLGGVGLAFGAYRRRRAAAV